MQISTTKTTPVGVRFRDDVLAALAQAVAEGAAPDRSTAIAAAVEEWLEFNLSERIAASYRRAYR